MPGASLVSVVIPCYNLGAYVGEALASVRAQTWQSVEAIVVDDGSQEEATVDALDAIAREGVPVLRIAHAGPSAARNAGIRAARGLYVYTLDADDRIEPTLIEKAVHIADADDRIGIVYSQTQFFGTMSGIWDLPPFSFPDILLGNMIPSGGLFRRSDWEQVNGYNANMIEGWEDYDFWLSLIELGRQVVQIPEPLYHYRRRAGSRSTDHPREALIRCYAQLFRNHLDLYAANIETIVGHIVDLRARDHAARAAAAHAAAG